MRPNKNASSLVEIAMEIRTRGKRSRASCGDARQGMALYFLDHFSGQRYGTVHCPL